jgi:beta-lactamase regulating signal transducer with metallopeptidase domain
MNSELTQWLIAHLIAGSLLGSMWLAWCLLAKRASAAQRSAVIGVFLVGMALLTPLQGIWWPQIDVPVLEATELTLEPALETPRKHQPDTVNPAVLASEPTPRPETRPSALPTIFLSIWLLGMVMLLSRFWLGAWLWRRLWAKARLTEKTADYELRVSEHTAVPMASGRQILMPVEWLQWPAEEKRAALEHERAHAQHRDGWMRGIAAIATALHWPSPLVWLAERRLRLAQEQRCDEAVLASGVDGEVYGRLLMRCAQKLRQSNWHSLSPVVACMARPSQLAERIEHIASGVPGARPARWRHVVVALLLVLAGLQAMHIRLVAQESQPSDKELVSIEVKFIETSKALEIKGAKRVGEHQRVLPASELNAMLRKLMQDEETKTTSYPRMITKMNQPVVVRSVVHTAGAEADLEKIGTPQLDWGGTILDLTPSRKAGKIKVEGQLGLSAQVGRQVDDLNGGNDVPVYGGVRVRLEHATLNEHDTLVVGPVRRPVKKGESAPDVWLLITVLKADTDALQANELFEQRQKAPKEKHYEFTETPVEDLIRFVAADAKLERYIIGDMGEPSPVALHMTAPPLEVLLHVCEKSGLQLKKSGRYWVVAKPGAAMPMTVAGDAARQLRGQHGQQYDFTKAMAGDVLRFLLTDTGAKFFSLPEDAPESQRLLTFSVNDSPFGLVEALCGTMKLNLTEENGVWRVRSASSAPIPRQTKP